MFAKWTGVAWGASPRQIESVQVPLLPHTRLPVIAHPAPCVGKP